MYRRVRRYIPPPSAPHKKWPVFKRAYRRNNERSCVLFFNILLEYQFFTEMLKQVRGSVNEYEDTDGPFYFGGGGGGGDISRYSTVLKTLCSFFILILYDLVLKGFYWLCHICYTKQLHLKMHVYAYTLCHHYFCVQVCTHWCN